MARSALMQRGVVAALVLAGLLPGQAPAGDEVDYSAPYLTLEDGKLVTKYPAKPHTNAQAAAPQTAAAAEAASEETAPLPVALGIAVVGLVVTAAAFVLLRKRRRP